MLMAFTQQAGLYWVRLARVGVMGKSHSAGGVIE